MNYTDEQIEKVIEKLEELSNLEGTETGEYWTCLIAIQRYPYMMSDEFKKASRKALMDAYNEAITND